MFDLDAIDLESLIKTIDESGIAEFCLTTPDGEIRISKTATDTSAPAVVAAAPAAAVGPAPAAPAPAAHVIEESAGQRIRTPMLGVFYRAPEPGAPPFVEVGSRVEPDTTVAIIEAMKVFTAVRAGVAGTIRDVLVNDRDFVEYDQALFVVESDAGSGE